jgi:hypothetical protein
MSELPGYPSLCFARATGLIFQASCEEPDSNTLGVSKRRRDKPLLYFPVLMGLFLFFLYKDEFK